MPPNVRCHSEAVAAQKAADAAAQQKVEDVSPATSSDTMVDLHGSRRGSATDVNRLVPALDTDKLVQQSLDHEQTQPSNTAEVAQLRKQHVGPNHALMYAEPLHIVRGEGTTLWTADGTAYLDCVNNVAHLGHSHPKVAAAVARQMFTLNTNSRYLHENFSTFAAALTATMPEPLSVIYATCSGSESNDLALQVARANSQHGAQHLVVMDGAYHGHTTATMELSPYKFDGPGGRGKADYVHVVPCPDPMRNRNLDGGAAARAAIQRARAAGGRVCAFFSESILSCGGQVVLPDGYLQAVYKEMHAEGAVCVADEVQCGFGRVGSAFWGFEMQGVVPDIVTLGKPIGNGFPMGAVVMSPALAQGFSNGMQYFATCGGCTAAGAAGLAVLSVIKEERLQAAALNVGAYLKKGLQRLQQGRPFLGDVRGVGLMLGIECVTDEESLAHAPHLAHWIKEQMKARHVLLTTDGAKCDNIIKIKPPLVFSHEDADHLVAQLEAVLNDFSQLPPAQQADLLEPFVSTAAASHTSNKKEAKRPKLH